MANVYQFSMKEHPMQHWFLYLKYADEWHYIGSGNAARIVAEQLEITGGVVEYTAW